MFFEFQQQKHKDIFYVLKQLLLFSYLNYLKGDSKSRTVFVLWDNIFPVGTKSAAAVDVSYYIIIIYCISY